MTDQVDFFAYHRAASSKLKKRFLKKPNVAEASAEFEQLKNHLARIEYFPYAGFTAIAKAKCEQGLLNPSGEVDSLIDAARFFLKADKETDEMGCPNFHEHLECAVCCFNLAIKVYEDSNQRSMAGCLCLEQADYYHKSQRYIQAIQHYKRAVDYFTGVPLQAITTMDKIATCQAILCDFRSSLNTTMTMMKLIKGEGAYHTDRITPLGLYNDFYKKGEVNRLLLLMILRPRPQNISKDFSDVLEQYTWPDEDSMASGSHFLDTLLGEDLFIYLRSLVMACSAEDLNSLKTVKDEVRDFLSPDQNVLMHHIVKQFTHSKH